MVEQDKIKSLKEKYEEMINNKLNIPNERAVVSGEYKKFKSEMQIGKLSWYEQACAFSEKIAKIDPDKATETSYVESIKICNLNITPAGAFSFSILLAIGVAILGVFISMLIPMLIGAEVGTFGVVFFLIVAGALYGIFGKYPIFLANAYRMKASNEMVLSIFYVVTYMRHTSNIENAIRFASDHLTGPLANDFRKVIWNVETGRFSSMKQSMDEYLESWEKYNNEFVEAFHLIQSSLYESSEERRLTLLDKSLDVILEETYEKMLHYAHNLKSPITMLHMLGIILPILGLVLLPLIASFMTDENLLPNELAFYIGVFYNIALPLIVFYFGKNILASRPTGYGDSNIGTQADLQKYKKIIVNIGKNEILIDPIYVTYFIIFVGMLLAFLPLILFNTVGTDIIVFDGESKCATGDLVQFGASFSSECYDSAKYQFLGYKDAGGNTGDLIGPYGLGAALMSLFLPLSLGVGIGFYYKTKSEKLMKIRAQTKKLENEFSGSLFQLGNRLGDGLPSEIALVKVAQVLGKSPTGNFFKIIASNIQRLGMSVNDAIFDSRIGAMVYYPSNLIESSMKVLVESTRKGPRVAARALMNISRYVKEIHRVNERLGDMMGEIISSMKSQVSFLTPVISGIVVGISSMVTYILIRLRGQMGDLTAGQDASSMSGIMQIFGDGIPTYYTQIIVGIYVLQITYLLTTIANNVENGSDQLNEDYMVGKNLIRSAILYTVLSGIIMILFNVVAAGVIEGI